ncbi:hypothetical protein V500_01561 [Pseudogymnoascus sp. VKM F-4518 (FW-2643)]|nr:hypothetical protein V500_01561 [Pseudogymnoascus sp. VKM F-4518 (FW-2643)]
MPRRDVADPCVERRAAPFGDLREKGRFEIEAEIPLEGPRDRDHPCVAGCAVGLRFEALIREYYRDCGQMDTENGQSLSGRQSRLTSDAAPSGLYMCDSALETTQVAAAQSPEFSGIRHVLPLFDANIWEAKGLADSSESTDRSDRPNPYISSFISARETRFKDHSPTQRPTLFSMATVNMNYVEFYNPDPALKASHAQLTRSVLNEDLPSLQPSISPPGDAEPARNVQDSDSLDDTLPSLDELFQGFRNGDIPQVPHQNHEPVHISKRQLIDESRLLTDATTPNSVYVPGNNQKQPLIIEDDSDDDSDDEAEAGAASSDLQPRLLASIEDQDASECGLDTQDTASTPSSLFGPSTPPDSEYLNAGCFSKDGQQRPSFAELDSTFPVQDRRPSPNCSELAETTGHDQIHQGVEKTIVDEMRPFPLRERAGGSCDPGSVCDIEDEPQQTSAEAGGPLPSSAAHSQYNQIDQESQNNTDFRGISSEERLWEKAIELLHCHQKAQEDEDKDDIESISRDNKGLISYCQQIKESLQHQRVEDETIVVAPLSQDREHSVKPYHKDNEDNEDDEDEEEDVRPPRRRKRRRIDSDATETATRKKVHTRSSTIAQAQNRTARESTVSRSPPADAESILGADYREYPFQGVFKRVRIGRETIYNLEFRLLDLPDSFRPSIGLRISNSTSSGELAGKSAHPQVCASHAKRSQPAPQKQRKRGRLGYTEQEDNKLMCLKNKGLPWKEIYLAFNSAFPGRERSIGSLQVHYCNELKNRDSESDDE